jgi:hypothetical protein
MISTRWEIQGSYWLAQNESRLPLVFMALVASVPPIILPHNLPPVSMTPLTSGKFATGINDIGGTGGKISRGVVDTSGGAP